MQAGLRPNLNERRALLVTDVVDSTSLALRIGDAEMVRLWAAHDRAARDLLPRWDGREIDKTDGMLLLFDAAADAVGYAIAHQEALKRIAPLLKARAGVHLGPVNLRENSADDIVRGAKALEVDGVAKSSAARIMSVAQGGQILLSAPVLQSLDAHGIRLQSHGHWRLKGLDEPIELFEVAYANAPFTPPPDGDKAYRVIWQGQGDMWLPTRISAIVCRPSATPSSAATSRCSSWRAVSMRGRACFRSLAWAELERRAS